MRYLIILLCVSLIPHLCFAKIIHVPGDSATIQTGINGAVNGDTVLVADGTYTGDGNRDIEIIGKSVLVMSRNGLEFTIIDCEGDYDNWISHRAFYLGTDAISTIRGFTILNGYTGSGGGAFCDSGSTTVFANCAFLCDSAEWKGAAAYCLNSVVLFDSCIFEGNRVTISEFGMGGGIYSVNSSLSIVSCTFTDNRAGIDASRGGGIYIEGGIAQLSGCTFVNNDAFSGGGICASGTSIQLDNCQFEEQNSYEGSAIYGCDSDLEIRNCDFIQGSHALSKMRFEGGSIIIDSCDIVSPGGFEVSTIHCSGASIMISNSIFEDTRKIWVEGGDSLNLTSCLISAGGGFNSSASFSRLSSCTFANNTIESDLVNLIILDGDSAIVENCIIAFNRLRSGMPAGIPILRCDTGSTSISCCDIYGNEGGDWIGNLAALLGDSGNISLNPLFCDTANGDFRVHVDSPCMPNNNNCEVLIGAYGIGCGYVCGDANGDESVNLGDAVFINNSVFHDGPLPDPEESGDANYDGSVNLGDAVYINNFVFRPGECATNPPIGCPPQCGPEK